MGNIDMRKWMLIQLTAVGAIFIVVGLFLFFRFDPDAYDTKTNAVISRIDMDWENDGEGITGIYTVYVDYKANGTEYRDVEFGHYDSSMYEGQLIEIYYMSYDPTQITTKGKGRIPYIGLIAALAGAAVISAGILKYRKKD